MYKKTRGRTSFTANKDRISTIPQLAMKHSMLKRSLPNGKFYLQPQSNSFSCSQPGEQPKLPHVIRTQQGNIQLILSSMGTNTSDILFKWRIVHCSIRKNSGKTYKISWPLLLRDNWDQVFPVTLRGYQFKNYVSLFGGTPKNNQQAFFIWD